MITLIEPPSHALFNHALHTFSLTPYHSLPLPITPYLPISLSLIIMIMMFIIIGGMESMSNIPYYLPGARTGYRLGNNTVIDGLVNDGLWDIYNNQHMGNCGELCADTYNITREEQDAYAIESYTRANSAWAAGKS